MTPPQIKAFLTEFEIRFDEIAEGLGVDPSYVSHLIHYRRRCSVKQRELEDYVSRRLDSPGLKLFSKDDAPPHLTSDADTNIAATRRQGLSPA
jgi:hypothetical protein